MSKKDKEVKEKKVHSQKHSKKSAKVSRRERAQARPDKY